MALTSIELTNFRTYRQADFDIAAGLTLIEGPNGSGKTNLLEAIYLMGGGKSWRAKDKQMVAYNQDFYRLKGEVDNSSVELRFSPAGKQLLIGGKTRAKAAHQLLPVVLFEPESLAIFLGGPIDRRRWLNRLLAMADLKYRETVHLYHHLLHQRNSLLRTRDRAAIKNQIFAWDLPLSESAQYISSQRRAVIARFSKRVEAVYNQVADKPAKIQLAYRSQTDPADYASNLLNQFNQALANDTRLGFTTYGPHRDDVDFMFNGKPATQTASRGELRTLILALKLLEYDWLKKITKRAPALLLDDVFSELDAKRRRFLLEATTKIQTILTSSDTAGISQVLPKNLLKIKLRGIADAR